MADLVGHAVLIKGLLRRGRIRSPNVRSTNRNSQMVGSSTGRDRFAFLYAKPKRDARHRREAQGANSDITHKSNKRHGSGNLGS